MLDKRDKSKEEKVVENESKEVKVEEKSSDDKGKYAGLDKKQLIARIEQLESEVSVLNNRLTRARSTGFPRGMGR